MEDSGDEGFRCPALLMQHQYLKLAYCIHRYHCNFGPEDHSNVYVSVLKSILNTAQRRREGRRWCQIMMLSGNTRGLDTRAREWEKLNP
jgi:hypothetical protein